MLNCLPFLYSLPPPLPVPRPWQWERICANVGAFGITQFASEDDPLVSFKEQLEVAEGLRSNLHR